jgi:glycosyltransferase involved in cell wall biosynthesis
MAFVSVVIATYNRAAMVQQTIRAALAQTRPPDEIVVSDDASTDETPSVLDALAAEHPRVRVFRRKTNSGGVGNWNDAVKHARGDFVALCSDDDRFLPDHLEASMAYLERRLDTGLVHSGFVDVLETPGLRSIEPRRLRSAKPLVIRRADLVRYMTRYYDWAVHPSTIVMRRGVWSVAGEFNPAYQLTDTDWFVRVVEKFPVALLARHGVYNRRHAGNWSNRLGSARMQREIFEIVEAAIDRLYMDRSMRRVLGRAAWRANVRIRLALTLGQRLRSGHADAACALWHGLLRETGWRGPEWAERQGERLIRRWCGECEGRPSVIPL